ncbi:KOW domain-containing RNA-binding protein [Alkalibacillus haloalkaliphilus]|uniref:KOW domain-containing RNA-binding protein n=1 Tax=Alkalibacillus haloalkaliphilus TaxID=94136 RepID=UPI0002FF32DD|nr:KOW domain-containing RNA-binding protein [Alkalibacillus haloalkaliphilus]
MNEGDSGCPKLGQLVRIKRGRESEQYAIIIGFDDRKFVKLADGEKRKFDRPKRKNLHHVELIDYVSPEVARSLEETGRVTNGKLRFAISKFVNESMTGWKKGDSLDGERRCN